MPPGLFANSNVIDMRAQTLKVSLIRMFLYDGDLFPPLSVPVLLWKCSIVLHHPHTIIAITRHS
jgi:hypothetical protein